MASPRLRHSAPLSEILLAHLQTIDPHQWPGIDCLTLDVVLESYTRVAAAGQVPGKDDLLHHHPELAAELEAFFAEPRFAPKRPQDRLISPLYFEQTD